MNLNSAVAGPKTAHLTKVTSSFEVLSAHPDGARSQVLILNSAVKEYENGAGAQNEGYCGPLSGLKPGTNRVRAENSKGRGFGQMRRF